MDSSLFNGGNYYEIKVPGTEIPKWLKFNHQSDGNSVSFRIGCEFPKAVVCIAFQLVEAHISGLFSVYVSVNGCKEKISFQDIEEMSGHLWLFSVSNRKLLDPNSYEENDIEVICEIDESNESSIPFENTEFIKWMGVHVECICCGLYNNRGDSRGVEIQRQLRRRNHGPTHAIHTQNPTSPSLNGFESNSDFGNGASNSGDGSCPTLLMVLLMIMMILTLIYVHHQRRYEHLD